MDALAELGQQKNWQRTNDLQRQRPPKPSAWTCPSCHRLVEPIEIRLPYNDRVIWIPRRYCSCPDGQAQMEADITAQNHNDRIARARELIADLDGKRWSKYRFGNWDNARHAGAYAARQAVERYVDNIARNGKNWLFVSGGYGLGKTHIAVAAVRKIAAEKLWQPHIVVWPELCAMTQEAWSSKNIDEAAVWGKARNAGILLIDDLDKLPSSPWAMGRLFALVNHRYDNQLPTIITANHSVAELRRLWRNNDVGSAVLSRIMGQLFGAVEVSGRDVRW